MENTQYELEFVLTNGETVATTTEADSYEDAVSFIQQKMSNYLLIDLGGIILLKDHIVAIRVYELDEDRERVYPTDEDEE